MNSFSKLIIISVILGSFLSCDPESAPEVHKLAESEQLAPVDTISIQETDEDYIGTYDVIDISRSPFRMYIPDAQRQRVVVLNMEGRIIRYIGSPGQGPGELGPPVSVRTAGDSIVVKQANMRGMAVFDTTGAYLGSHRLSEEVQSLGAHAFLITDGGYIHAVTRREAALNLPASPEQPTLAHFNGRFELKNYFGSYPELYTEAEYALAEASTDMEGEILVVGYNLTPNVQVYDSDTHRLVNMKQLSHPRFKHPTEALSIGMAQDNRSGFIERLSDVSLVRRTYVTPNQTLVQGFENRSPAYYENDHDPAEREDYAILADLNSDQQEALSLPGPILARDDTNRIYVELDPTPDQRKIGVYEVTGWDD